MPPGTGQEREESQGCHGLTALKVTACLHTAPPAATGCAPAFGLSRTVAEGEREKARAPTLKYNSQILSYRGGGDGGSGADLNGFCGEGKPSCLQH